MARGKIEKRGSRKRQVKKVVLIVTEGSRTEPKYFGHFRTRNTNIDIKVVPSHSAGGETDYMSLVRKAAQHQKKDQLSAAIGDSVWVVADGDVNLNNPDPINERNRQLNMARKIAARSNIRLLISNPCFEFWYLLHFQYTSKHLKDYNAAKKELLSYFPEYEKTDDVYEQLLPYMEQAIQNAHRLERYHIENGESVPFTIAANPYTEVYQLIEALR